MRRPRILGDVVSPRRSRGIAIAAMLVLAGACQQREGDRSLPVPTGVVNGAFASAIDLRVTGCRDSLVRGAGAMVRDSAGRRFILTAAHVVAGAEAILARTSNPDEHAVATVLLALDPVNDLALLGTELALPAAELGNLDDGQRGIAIVFRGGTATPLPFRVVNRAVVNIDDIYGENTISRSGYRVEIELQPGDSGAVMVDADGSAAGVLYSKSRTVAGNAFATDTSTLGDLMRDAAIADPIRGIDSGECP